MGPELAWIKKDFNNANFEDKPWVTKTLHDIRDAAVNKVLNGIANNRAKKDNKFTIHFKKNMAPSDSISIYAADCKQRVFFSQESLKRAYYKYRRTSR